MKYIDFLNGKKISDVPSGIPDTERIEINGKLFKFQQDIVKWALKRGCACIWADCGLGKTAMQLEWAKIVCNYTGKSVLIIAPLAVSSQTANIEAKKFGVDCRIASCAKDISGKGIYITNYEKLDKFDLSDFGGVVLDESSILKNYSGKIRNMILEKTMKIPFRLACTATPSPNDYMELGNHAEFVGAMRYTEMLSMFFIHDGGETAKWRLKGHAKKRFFEWVASWAVFIRRPSDLGYSDDGFTLPKIEYHNVTVKTEPLSGYLFSVAAETLQDRQAARRESIDQRVNAAIKVIEENKRDAKDQFCVWCNLNAESDTLAKERPGIVNIQGSDSDDYKTEYMIGFATGKVGEIVTKPKIAGFGMNWQNCSKVIFLGLSDSYEQFYQAVRRFYRFGQRNDVHVWIITADKEGSVVENIRRKDRDANAMYDEMLKYMNIENKILINGAKCRKSSYAPDQEIIMPNFLQE